MKDFYTKGDHPYRSGLLNDKINYVHVDNFNSKLVYFTAYEHENFKGKHLTLKVERNEKTRAFNLNKYIIKEATPRNPAIYWSNSVSSF